MRLRGLQPVQAPSGEGSFRAPAPVGWRCISPGHYSAFSSLNLLIVKACSGIYRIYHRRRAVSDGERGMVGGSVAVRSTAGGDRQAWVAILALAAFLRLYGIGAEPLWID